MKKLCSLLLVMIAITSLNMLAMEQQPSHEAIVALMKLCKKEGKHGENLIGGLTDFQMMAKTNMKGFDNGQEEEKRAWMKDICHLFTQLTAILWHYGVKSQTKEYDQTTSTIPQLIKACGLPLPEYRGLSSYKTDELSCLDPLVQSLLSKDFQARVESNFNTYDLPKVQKPIAQLDLATKKELTISIFISEAAGVQGEIDRLNGPIDKLFRAQEAIKREEEGFLLYTWNSIFK